MDVEPRMGVDDGVFININHHHNQNSDSIPDALQLRSLIETSIEKVNSEVVDHLFNE